MEMVDRRGPRCSTENCDAKRVNVITDVATAVSGADSQALPGIHARPRRLRLLPGDTSLLVR
jgi:hypothetical protein